MTELGEFLTGEKGFEGGKALPRGGSARVIGGLEFFRIAAEARGGQGDPGAEEEDLAFPGLLFHVPELGVVASKWFR